MRYIRSLTSLSLLFAWLLADRINRYGPDCRGGMFSGIFRRHLSVVWFSDFVGLLPNCGEFRIISPERIHAATVIFGDTNPLYAIFQVSGRVMTVLANSSAASFLIVFYRLVPAIFRRLSRKNYFIVFSGV